MIRIPNDCGDGRGPCQLTRAETPLAGNQLKCVPPCHANDNRLQYSVFANGMSEFLQGGFGELGARLARVRHDLT